MVRSQFRSKVYCLFYCRNAHSPDRYKTSGRRIQLLMPLLFPLGNCTLLVLLLQSHCQLFLEHYLHSCFNMRTLVIVDNIFYSGFTCYCAAISLLDNPPIPSVRAMTSPLIPAFRCSIFTSLIISDNSF